MLDQTIQYLETLVGFPTVSSDSNLELIRWTDDLLRPLGADTEIMADATGEKANLFATFGPKEAGGIVLSGHTDVVPASDQRWSSDPFQLKRTGDRLYGRGTADMKGFIAACLALAPRIAGSELRRPLHFAFTYDEETGCLGGRQLVSTLAKQKERPSLAIVGEPTSMQVIEGHKGCHEYTTRFRGLEGHGSDPDAGVNAVEYAVRYVARLLEIKAELATRPLDGSRFRPPWSTVNVGRIAGGVAPNVIAGTAEVEWETRPVRSEDHTYVKEAMARYIQETLLPTMQDVYPDASVDTDIIGEVEGLEPMDQNAARDLVFSLTGSNSAEVVPFGTEAGLFQSLGMSVVVCGPGSIEQAHKPDEFIEVGQLEACLEMLNRLVDSLTR